MTQKYVKIKTEKLKDNNIIYLEKIFDEINPKSR